MIDELWKLEEPEPDAKLDRRVRRRMRACSETSSARRARQASVRRTPVAKISTSPRSPAPFLPLERGVYALLVAVYVFYAGVRAVQVLQEAQTSQVLTPIASATDLRDIDHAS
jgi:hypothetical protein